MYIMSNPVLLYSGIVWKKENSYHIGSQSLSKVLSEYKGKNITLALHHWPDERGDYCFFCGFCKVHNENPSFLFNWKRTGVLKTENQLGDEIIPYWELEGHHCRVVLVWEDYKVFEEEPDWESIQRGTKDLSELLETLQQTLKEIK